MGAVRRAFKTTLIRTGLMGAHYRLTRERIRILMYHGVSDSFLSVAQFERQLEFLKRHFAFAWVRELPELLDAGPPERPIAVLTFDDGRANNAHIVAPLLQQHGVKATFFLLPGLMRNEHRMMWNHELACRLLLLSEHELAAFVREPVGDRKAAVLRFVNALKPRPHEEKMETLERARELTSNLEFNDWMKNEYQLMSLSEAAALPDTVEIGSHTVNHPILTRIPPEKAEEEIVLSKRMLEEQLGIEVRSFCYPNGDCNDEVVDIARRHYDVAVVTEGGAARSGDDLLRLPRIPAPRNVPDLASALR